MKIWIPTCGDAVKLLAPWSASLVLERRNFKTLTALGSVDTSFAAKGYGKAAGGSISLAIGDELVFDRLYVRQGRDARASVTFIVKRASDESVVGCRFWVKLSDANEIDAELVSRENPVGGFAPKQYVAALRAEKDPQLAVTKAASKQKRGELDVVRDVCRAACHGKTSSHALTMARQLLKKLRELDLSPHQSGRSAAVAEAASEYWKHSSPEIIRDTASWKGRKGNLNADHWHVVSTERFDNGETKRVMVMCWKVHVGSGMLQRVVTLTSDASIEVITRADGSVKSTNHVG